MFQGARDSSRLRRLLLADAVDQSGCQAHLVASAVEELEVDLAAVHERLTVVEARLGPGAESAPMVCDHVVYLGTSSGYRLTETRGLLPAAGDVVGEANATVVRIGRSPFPGDPRPCVFAIASPAP